MVLSGAMASYAIVRFRDRIRGTSAVFYYFVAGHIVTAQVVAVSIFLFTWAIGVENTRIGLALVYCASGLPFVVILCRGFFSTVTRELFEAAEIDGCSEPRILGSIMLPLSRPVLATAVIFQFTYVWNEFILALVLIRTQTKLTLPVGVFRAVMDRYQTDFTAAFAAATITSIPVIAIYLAAQRQFTGGLGGALKG
jgi:ABC-type glycerol-3-phosphate transport system permease component